jgi:hypothetical protein
MTTSNSVSLMIFSLAFLGSDPADRVGL